MNRTLIILFTAMLGYFGLGLTAFAQDYSFEIPGKEGTKKEKFTWGGNLEAQYIFFKPNDSSPDYKYRFTCDEYFSQYSLDLYLNGEYQTKDLGLHLKSRTDYDNDAKHTTFDLLEFYGNYNLSIGSFIQAGKIRYNWGKGYAFNPTGFVNPTKDPNDPDAVREGLLSSNMELFKSFSSDILTTAALTTVVIPAEEDINERVANPDHIKMAAKLSFLLGTTDIDLLGYYDFEEQARWGAAFAHNLWTDFEIHGEYAYFTHMAKSTIVNNRLSQMDVEGCEYLLGIRWLNPWDITIIAEYYRDDAGLSDDEFQDYLHFLRQNLNSGNELRIKQALGILQNLKGNTLMQEYMYFSVKKPEPFDWLYFTPTISMIYNIKDQSLLISSALSYTPMTNIELLFNPTFMIGEDDTEYGSQRFERKIEISINWYY